MVLKRTGGNVAWHEHHDIWWYEATAKASDHRQPEEMKAEDPCLSFTLQAQLVNRKAYCTPLAVIWFMRL